MSTISLTRIAEALSMFTQITGFGVEGVKGVAYCSRGMKIVLSGMDFSHLSEEQMTAIDLLRCAGYAKFTNAMAEEMFSKEEQKRFETRGEEERIKAQFEAEQQVLEEYAEVRAYMGYDSMGYESMSDSLDDS